MPILTDIGELALCLDDDAQADVQTIPDAAVVWHRGVICWAGRRTELPPEYRSEEVISADGRLVIPGLVDCHTHLAFGGWRADEFEMRLKGASYLDIARAGGGILRTMRQTREATDEELERHCLAALDAMARLGVTTVECKSGYGLSSEEELRLLRLYNRLGKKHPVGLVSTLLGAHVVPPEFGGERAAYVELIMDDMIPTAAADGLAAFCDVFVEQGAFTVEEAERILTSAAAHGLGAKLHVDQLSDVGGGELAARIGAVSADHLEKTSADGIAAMAGASAVAVCLPIASLYLRQTPMNARAFVDAGVRVAVATDFNPGSAPSYDLPLAMMLSCTMNGLTPAEALKGATIHAARAVSRHDEVGSIEPGKRADLAVIDAPDVNHWLYHFRPNACTATYIGGEPVTRSPGD